MYSLALYNYQIKVHPQENVYISVNTLSYFDISFSVPLSIHPMLEDSCGTDSKT